MAKRTGIMLCYPYEEKRLQKWGHVAWIQPKLDGVRCRALIRPDGAVLVSSSEEIISSVPHINRDLRRRFSSIQSELELDGELYVHGQTFEDINSVVSRTANIHPEYSKIQLHLFDVVSPFDQVHRFQKLTDLFKQGMPHSIKKVEPQLITSHDEVMFYYDDYISRGYEGFVLRGLKNFYKRSRSTDLMKFKPKQSDYYRIVGFWEEISQDGEPKGRLGAIQCESDGETFNVGTGFKEADRIRLWAIRQSLPGKYCHVCYQHKTAGKGVPRFPVYSQVIDPLTMEPV